MGGSEFVMNGTLRIVIFIALAFYFGWLVNLLRKRQLILKYTLLWLLAGVTMLLIAIFPNALKHVLNNIGIVELTNGLFAIILFSLIIITVFITSIVSKQNEQFRALTQQCALYEKRIRELEALIEKDQSKL